jgi:hypothetical protein
VVMLQGLLVFDRALPDHGAVGDAIEVALSALCLPG